MIQSKQRVESLYVELCSLLPVYPPKVNAVFFVRLVNDIKIRIPKIRIADSEFYALFCSRVNAVCKRHFLIHTLVASYSVARMKIQRNVKPFIM